MIVRKYCERKRGRGSIFGKRKNKKDLMGSSEVKWQMGISTNVGPGRNAVPTKSGPKT